MEQFLKVGNRAGIRELVEILTAFKPDNLEKTPAADMVVKAKKSLIKESTL